MINAGRPANTVNIVHKLVTIFAGHLDSFVVINNQLKLLKATATSGSGQISVQMTLIQFAGTCKNCAPSRSARRGTAYLACTPDDVTHVRAFSGTVSPTFTTEVVTVGEAGLTGQVQSRLLRQVTFTKLYCRAVSSQPEEIQVF